MPDISRRAVSTTSSIFRRVEVIEHPQGSNSCENEKQQPLFQGKMLRTTTEKRLLSTVKSQNLKLLSATLVSAAHMFFLLCCCGHAHPARCGMQFLKFNKQVQRSNRSKRRRNAAAVTGCWYLYFSRPLTKQKKIMVFLFSSCPEWINRKRDLKFRRVVAEKKACRAVPSGAIRADMFLPW